MPQPDMTAYCGLNCESCPIYLATREGDNVQQLRMRQEIVRICGERYGLHYELKDITDCDGCRTEGGRLFSDSSACIIRNCARRKMLTSCSGCSDYPCRELGTFFENEPGAKARLDAMRDVR